MERKPNIVSPKIAKQMNEMFAKLKPSTVNKPEPEPFSISSIKKGIGVSSAVIRHWITMGEVKVPADIKAKITRHNIELLLRREKS